MSVKRFGMLAPPRSALPSSSGWLKGPRPRARAGGPVGAPLAHLPVVVVGRAHHDVGVAIPVHVPRRAYRVAEMGIRLVALHRPVPGGRKARGGAVVDVGPPFGLLPVAEVGTADDDVRIAVPVHVP